jgi:hypothetical protein
MTKCDKIFVPGNHSWPSPIFVGKATAYPRGTPYCAHQRDRSVQRERERERERVSKHALLGHYMHKII